MDTEKQDEYSTLARKLFNVQQGLSVPKNQTNSFGKYKYRSCEDILEAVKPLLREQECVINLEDEIVEVGDRIYVKARATFYSISDSDGDFSVVAFAREPLTKKGMDESQITGTASSYARKYALNGLLCIDDTKDADTMDNRSRKETPKAERESIDTDANGEPFNDGEYQAGAVYDATKIAINKLCVLNGWKPGKVKDFIKYEYGQTLAGMKNDDNKLTMVLKDVRYNYSPVADSGETTVQVGDE